MNNHFNSFQFAAVLPEPSPVSALCWQIHRRLAVLVPLLRVWVHCPRASNGLLPPRSYLPSSRTPLLGPSPLRTVLKTFAIYGSSPSKRPFGEDAVEGREDGGDEPCRGTLGEEERCS